MKDRSPDDTRMREYIYSLTDIAHAEAILDIGCGDGYDLWQIGRIANPNVRLVGMDSSPKAIESARLETQEDSRFSFLEGTSHGKIKGSSRTEDQTVVRG